MNEVIAQAKDAIEREDYDFAVQLLRPLADADDAEAQFLIGHLYFTFADVSKEDSRSWLQRAGAHDHPEALYFLACLGDTFDFGPPEDDACRTLLVRAAELGLAQAQRDVGCLYAIGENGFPKDESLGRFWYGRAAAQGHADAQYNLGTMLLYGEGGPKDPEGALMWLRRGSEQDEYCANFLREITDEHGKLLSESR